MMKLPRIFVATALLLTAGAFGTAKAQNAALDSPGFESSLLKQPADWKGQLFSANYDFPDHAADVSGQPWLKLDPSDPSGRDQYF